MSDDDSTPIVLQFGSYMVQAGFGGDDAPRAVFPTVVGRPRPPPCPAMMPFSRDCYVAEDALFERRRLRRRYPVHELSGVMMYWDDFEKILHHTFYNELRADPEEHPVLLAEPLTNPPRYREKAVEILMETFACPQCQLVNEASLSLLSSGITTGMVVDCGYGTSRVSCLNDLHLMPYSVRRVAIGGKTLSEYMCKLLNDMPGMVRFTTSSEMEIVRDIKERVSYVSAEHTPEECTAKDYELPDGTVITVGDARCKCPEALFRPSLLNGLGGEIYQSSQGLHHAVYESLHQGVDPDFRPEILRNVFVCGGNSMFGGLSERLLWELQQLGLDGVKVRAPPERKFSTWIGESIHCSLSTFSDVCITKAMYDEHGPGLVRWTSPY